ncbi:unnamed protein product [Blepharisma stoltei]|uniref:Uncharacterized protein n=1 Tax=Blepharisma stoltei TaxID=1481888 RepID=A0AAU9ILH7_9CILI|nr:unnamed protein product [Blepharisma stoltei]
MAQRTDQPTNIVFSGSEKPINKFINPTKIHKATSQQILINPFSEPSFQIPTVTTNTFSPHSQFPKFNKERALSYTPISMKLKFTEPSSPIAKKLSFRLESLPQQLVASKADKIDKPIIKCNSPKHFASNFDKSIRSSFAGNWKMMQSGNFLTQNPNFWGQESDGFRNEENKKLMGNKSGPVYFSAKKFKA